MKNSEAHSRLWTGAQSQANKRAGARQSARVLSEFAKPTLAEEQCYGGSVRATYQAQLLAEYLYAQYDTPVLITAGLGTILAFSHQPHELTDESRRQGILLNDPPEIPEWISKYLDPQQDLIRSPGNEELQALPRTVITIRHRTYPVGYVIAIDPDARIPSDWPLQNERALTAVGVEIELSRSRSLQIQLAVRAVLSPDSATRRIGIDSLSSLRAFDEAQYIRVIVSEVSDNSWHKAWDGSQGGDATWAEAEGRFVMILTEGERTPLAEVGRYSAFLQRGGSSPIAYHGIGGRVRGLSEAAQSYREALAALRVAKISRDGSRVAHWDHLGAWRSLAALDKDLALATIDPRIKRLVESEREANITVLREYLERQGEVDRIATDLHLHRSTVYSRLKSIENKYELDLGKPEDRLTAIVGLRLAQLFLPTDQDLVD